MAWSALVDQWAGPVLAVTWQMALLTVFAWLCERALHLRHPRPRHALWWFVLVAPLLVVPLRVVLTRADAVVSVPVPEAAAPLVISHRASVSLPPAPVALAPSAPRPDLPLPPLRRPLRPADALALVWATGVTVFALRLLHSHRKACRLLAQSAPVEIPTAQQAFAALCAEAGLRRPATLHRSDSVGAPALYGWRRPVVLLPGYLLDEIGPEQLRSLLAHEVAHLSRRDFAANLLQRLLEALLFFHPAAWLASRRVTLSREELCDAWVLSRGIPAAAYARSLTEAAERARLRPALALIGLAEERGSLLRRVETVMAGGSAGRITRRLAVALGAALLLCVGAFAVVRLQAPAGQRHQKDTVTIRAATGPLTEQEVEAALRKSGIRSYRLAYELPFEQFVKVEVEYYEQGRRQAGDLGGYDGGARAGQQTLLLLAREEEGELRLSFDLLSKVGSVGSGAKRGIPLHRYGGARYWGGIPVHELTLGRRTPFWCFSADREGKNSAFTPDNAQEIGKFASSHDLAVVVYLTITRVQPKQQTKPDQPSRPSTAKGTKAVVVWEVEVRTSDRTPPREVLARLQAGDLIYFLGEERRRSSHVRADDVEGWATSAGLIVLSAPGADARLLTAAQEREHPREGGGDLPNDLAALALYRRLRELFPQSSYAPLALYRYGQIAERLAVRATNEAYEPRDEGALAKYRKWGLTFEDSHLGGSFYYGGDAYRELVSRHPRSEWADDAAFRLLKIHRWLGAGWEGGPTEPIKELKLWQQYLGRYPRTNSRPEALLEMVYLNRALFEIYQHRSLGFSDPRKARIHRQEAERLCRQVEQEHRGTEFAAQARKHLAELGAGQRVYLSP